MEFEPLGEQDANDLELRRDAVRTLARSEGAPSLHELQHVLDMKMIQPDAGWMLEAVGVCFGDILATDGSLHWQMMTDEYGRAPALRLKDAELAISPMDMVARRVEDGDSVDLELLRSQLIEQLAELDG